MSYWHLAATQHIVHKSPDPCLGGEYQEYRIHGDSLSSYVFLTVPLTHPLSWFLSVSWPLYPGCPCLHSVGSTQA